MFILGAVDLNDEKVKLPGFLSEEVALKLLLFSRKQETLAMEDCQESL